jgi:uncharacterized membrane protein YfcA
LEIAALFVAGAVAGTLNVIAGGGSFLTLPVLIFMGLPPGVANATNRVAIWMQNVGAVWGFSRHSLIAPDLVARLAIPATAGAVVGAFAALHVGDADLRRILATLMVVISLWTLLGPAGRKGAFDPTAPVRVTPAAQALFFLIGAYGGFIQAGVGFFLLTGTTLLGLDLVRGNALKVAVVLIWTSAAIGVFAWGGQIDWARGIALGFGNLAGGQLGVRLTVTRGHAWVKAVVTVLILVFAVRLWLTA